MFRFMRSMHGPRRRSNASTSITVVGKGEKSRSELESIDALGPIRDGNTHMQLWRDLERMPMPHVVDEWLKPIHQNIVLFPALKFPFRRHPGGSWWRRFPPRWRTFRRRHHLCDKKCDQLTTPLISYSARFSPCLMIRSPLAKLFGTKASAMFKRS